MSAIEQELVDATGFEPAKEYKDRQDYLAALARAVADTPEETFDALPVEATTWFNEAARAIKARKVIHDFPDLVFEDFPPTPEGVTMVSLEHPGELHQGIADALGESIKESTPYPDPKPKKPRKPKQKMTGEFNRYGKAVGTRADMAIKLFEQGVTMAEVKNQVGDSKYNLLNELAAQGHLVEKLEDKTLKLTHKDDVTA